MEEGLRREYRAEKGYQKLAQWILFQAVEDYHAGMSPDVDRFLQSGWCDSLMQLAEVPREGFSEKLRNLEMQELQMLKAQKNHIAKQGR